MSHKVTLIEEHLNPTIDSDTSVGPVLGVTEERLAELIKIADAALEGEVEGLTIPSEGGRYLNTPAILVYLSEQAQNANEAALLCMFFGQGMEQMKNPISPIIMGIFGGDRG